ncbi:hypothetical protein [Arthrobacter terricola]|uniref:hypothetical protein n=1 Tax=Arthrobacter terricola TaxID=2547396 RepID=UPI001F1E33BD|nr:hypothetical protein [Arthrobacter terricola]
MNRRSNAIRGAIVVSASKRDFCCRSHPVSIASNTASSSSRCAIPSTRTSRADPGASATPTPMMST